MKISLCASIFLSGLVALGQTSAAAPSASPASPTSSLWPADASVPPPLAAEDAFRLHDYADVKAGTLALHWDIEPGYYMYDEKLAVHQPTESGTAAVPVVVNSPSVTLEDEYFGKVKVYYESLDATVHTRSLNTPWLDVRWQGCSEIHQICYPPQQTRLVLNATTASGNDDAPGNSLSLNSSPESFFGENLQKAGGKWLVVALMFLAGIALSFTPCVLPMIPILTGILGGGYQAGQTGSRRLFLLGLTYVLSMAATYSVLGVAVALTGQAFQALIQHPAIIISSAVAVFIMALWIMGVVQFRLPASWSARLQTWQSHRGGTGIASAAVAGCFASLIVSPCISPPLVGALVFVSQTGEWLFGGAALMALGLGMGVPLLLACVGMQQLLPRAGQWMDSLNLWLGTALMLVALWLLERLVSDQITSFILAIVLVLVVFSEGVLDLNRPRTARLQRLYHGFLALVLVYALMLFVSVAQGQRHGLHFGQAGQGVGAAIPPADAPAMAHKTASFTAVQSLEELNAELGATDGRSTMLDVYADWCISCKELERYTFADPRVADRMSRLHLLRLDVTHFNPTHQRLFDEFGLFGPPALLFFNADGQEIDSTRIIGFIDAQQFIRRLNSLTNQASRPSHKITPS
ncbi:MAG: protein-disulfide reductase DsbD [Proteobacteria bacterium]|nr:protein-disulfide reductase DsbD [Pseudomonadota bacterium]